MKLLGKLKTYESKEIDNSYVSIGFECMERGVINPDKCYDLLGKSGIKYARCQTGWALCEKEKGIYNFDWLDSIVENLTSRGVIPWFSVSYGNPIYMKDAPNPTAVGCVPIYYGEETTQAWCNYVKEIAKRYKDVVKHYEIWNEPDLNHFWYPKTPNGKDYGEFVKLTGSAIREMNKDAKIGTVVASPYNFEYIDDMLNCFDKNDINFFCYHAYTTAPEFRFPALIKALRNKLDSRGLCDVELWQGESGYPSWAYENHWLVKSGCNNETPQAVFLLRRYFIDIYYGVKRGSFFQIADMWERQYEKAKEILQKPAAHGILNGNTYTPKKSYFAISNLSTIMSGDFKPSDNYSTIEAHTKNHAEFISAIAMSFEKDGCPLYAYYIPSELDRNTDYDFAAKLTVDKGLNEPVIIDLYTGDVFEIDSDFGVSTGLTYYDNLPIKNYPLIITDKSVIETK